MTRKNTGVIMPSIVDVKNTIYQLNIDWSRCQRLNRETGISRYGPATVTGSEATYMSLEKSGKAWQRVDLKSGELPV